MCESVRKNEDGNSRSERKAEYNDCFVNGKPTSVAIQFKKV